jgi:hypothetical protein
VRASAAPPLPPEAHSRGFNTQAALPSDWKCCRGRWGSAPRGRNTHKVLPDPSLAIEHRSAWQRFIGLSSCCVPTLGDSRKAG